MQPAVTPSTALKVKHISKQRHFLAVFFISFMWGVFGVDRMYLGKWGTGFFKLISLGGFGIWVVVDLWLIMAGLMRDAHGREMLQYIEYKSFAYKTVFVFAVVFGLLVLINGVVLILAISQLINDMQNGSIPGLENIDQLLQGTSGGLSPQQMTELGL